MMTTIFVQQLGSLEGTYSCSSLQVEQDLQKLAADARRARQTLEYQMVEFERKKIQDIKVTINTPTSRQPLGCFFGVSPYHCGKSCHFGLWSLPFVLLFDFIQCDLIFHFMQQFIDFNSDCYWSCRLIRVGK